MRKEVTHGQDDHHERLPHRAHLRPFLRSQRSASLRHQVHRVGIRDDLLLDAEPASAAGHCPGCLPGAAHELREAARCTRGGFHLRVGELQCRRESGRVAPGVHQHGSRPAVLVAN
jgi:hypothetical protein